MSKTLGARLVALMKKLKLQVTHKELKVQLLILDAPRLRSYIQSKLELGGLVQHQGSTKRLLVFKKIVWAFGKTIFVHPYGK